MEKIKITGSEPINTLHTSSGGLFKKVDKDYVEAANFYSGLTIRQYYAGLAMQGMCSNEEFFRITSAKMKPKDIAEFYATIAVEQADCLIAELNKMNT